jgi:hypothetical protein
MPRAVSARTQGAYGLDLANLGRLRQRLLADSRVKGEQLKELLAAIDKVAVEIRPFLPQDD